jgi:hypothetical protein
MILVPRNLRSPLRPADIRARTEVLKYVESEKTEPVLNHINTLTTGVCYLIIDLQPSAKTLADGRNAHINL